MASKFYEVQVSRLIDRGDVTIRSTITSAEIAKTKKEAWREFCKRREWLIYRSPSNEHWERTITVIDITRWEYICASFYELRRWHG